MDIDENITNNLIHIECAMNKMLSLIKEIKDEMNEYRQKLEDEQKESDIRFNMRRYRIKKSVS